MSDFKDVESKFNEKQAFVIKSYGLEEIKMPYALPKPRSGSITPMWIKKRKRRKK